MQFILFGRLMWWSPATLTRWWASRVFRGSDESCNPSVAVVIPPFGAFIVFYKRGPLRTLPCEECRALVGVDGDDRPPSALPYGWRDWDSPEDRLYDYL